MRKVKQRKNWDCLTACVASIFDVNYEEVPLFAKPSKADQWLKNLKTWAGKRGYDTELLWEYKLSELENNLVIGVGPSPRNNGNTHAVLVDETLKVTFDPGWPLRKTVKEIEYVIIFRRKNGSTIAASDGEELAQAG